MRRDVEDIHPPAPFFVRDRRPPRLANQRVVIENPVPSSCVCVRCEDGPSKIKAGLVPVRLGSLTKQVSNLRCKGALDRSFSIV